VTLSHETYLTHLRAESARFLDVLRDADPALPVPSCPEWRSADLLWHLGEVQWFWGTVVAERLQSVEALEGPARPGTYAELLSFFAEQSDRLQTALSSTDPSERVYMWADDKTVRYIGRRQAHEALIHRLDAELTVDEVTPLDADLATDGVDEVLRVMFGGCPPWGTFTPSSTHVHVVASDTGTVVPVVLGRFTGTNPDSGTAYDEPEVSVTAADAAAQPQATVKGSAEDLDAWLWHRRDDARLTVEGDQGTFARLAEMLSQPIN